MGDRSGQQGSQVYYDSDMGQYYTQTPQNRSPFAGVFGNQLNQLNIPSGSKESIMVNALFGKGGERNYLNNFGQSSPALQQTAPYEYANTSIAELFPMLQGALQGSQGGAMEGGAGLLGSQGATGSASSGAGRFM